MSQFIAGQAFPAADDFAAAKIAVFAASVISAAVGVSVPWSAGRDAAAEATPNPSATTHARTGFRA